MIKALLLYGINCTAAVWKTLLPLLSSWDCEVLSYPHDVTLRSEAVDDITQWVKSNVSDKHYDVVIGHSMGGLIALQLASSLPAITDKVICLDTNLRPAGAFFRSLMTETHMVKYGMQIKEMMAAERPFYTHALMRSLQDDFDYTPILSHITCPVFLLMGDRGKKDAHEHLYEMNLSQTETERMNIRFVPDSCHMQMVENPKALADILNEICEC